MVEPIPPSMDPPPLLCMGAGGGAWCAGAGAGRGAARGAGRGADLPELRRGMISG